MLFAVCADPLSVLLPLPVPPVNFCLCALCIDLEHTQSLDPIRPNDVASLRRIRSMAGPSACSPNARMAEDTAMHHSVVRSMSAPTGLPLRFDGFMALQQSALAATCGPDLDPDSLAMSTLVSVVNGMGAEHAFVLRSFAVFMWSRVRGVCMPWHVYSLMVWVTSVGLVRICYRAKLYLALHGGWWSACRV